MAEFIAHYRNDKGIFHHGSFKTQGEAVAFVKKQEGERKSVTNEQGVTVWSGDDR